MSNVLSQDEIDALLNAISSGEEPQDSDLSPKKGEVRLYDFRDANKFPKEQIRTLESVFDNFAQLLANQLAGTLRAMCSIKLLAVEERLYKEFNNAIPSPVLLAVMSMAPLEGSLLMMIAPELAYAMVNRVFGGMHDEADYTKSFTEIEMVVLERIVHQFMGLLDDAWRKVVEVDAVVERIETSPQFAQVVAMTEPVAIVTLEVAIGDTVGLVSICIPHIAIEPVAQQLSTMLWFSHRTNQDIPPRSEDISRSLSKSAVQLNAKFNETTAMVKDILSLQVGDVIQLNHKVNEKITMTVEGQPKFSGLMGVRGTRYAIQVADVLNEEDDYE